MVRQIMRMRIPVRRVLLIGGKGQSGDRLTLILIAGTLPGVIAGSVIRIELLLGLRVFDLVVAAVLIAAGYSAVAPEAVRRRRSGPARHG